MKKVLSVVLALALVLALAAPAFASSKTIEALGTGATTNMNAKAYSPKIKITVPTTGDVILNPYKLEVTVDNEPMGSDEVICVAQTIKNESDVAIDVGATVTGTPATGVTLLTAEPAATDTKNSVFLQFQAKAGADPTSEDDADIIATVAAKAVVAANKADATKKVAKMDAENGEVHFLITGKANGNAATTWTEKMTVKVAIAFTFTPSSGAAAGGEEAGGEEAGG